MKASKQGTPSWRDVLEIHPAAELLPMMSAEELRDLGEDIKKQGLISPIVLWSPGTREDKDQPVFLLDGRNRLDAMELAGIRIVWSGKLGGFASLSTEHLYGQVRLPDANFPAPGVDPWEFVLGANVRRRHLTIRQKRDIAAAILRAEPMRSDRQIGELAHLSKNTAKSVREDLERRGQIDHVSKRADTRGRQQPAERPKLNAEPHQSPRQQGPSAELSTSGATNAAEPATASEKPQETTERLRNLHLASLRDADRNQRIQEVLTMTSALGLTIRDLSTGTDSGEHQPTSPPQGPPLAVQVAESLPVFPYLGGWRR